MRAREFISEDSDKLAHHISATLPATYIIPSLRNQDPYMQYRFLVAMASAKGRKQREQDNVPDMKSTSVFGENQLVVGYGDDVSDDIDYALKQIGKSGKILIATETSHEPNGTGVVSPIKPFKGYKK